MARSNASHSLQLRSILRLHPIDSESHAGSLGMFEKQASQHGTKRTEIDGFTAQMGSNPALSKYSVCHFPYLRICPNDGSTTRTGSNGAFGTVTFGSLYFTTARVESAR